MIKYTQTNCLNVFDHFVGLYVYEQYKYDVAFFIYILIYI